MPERVFSVGEPSPEARVWVSERFGRVVRLSSPLASPVDLHNLTQGTVIRSTGKWYQVRTDDGREIVSRIRGRFRLNGMQLTNPVAVGDRVKLTVDDEVEDEIRGMIKEVLPRRNMVVRQSPRKLHSLHLLAANIDQAAVVMTIVAPKLKQGFIDRFLLMTEPYEIPTAIIFNKADLYDEEAMVLYEYLRTIYTQIDYQVFLTSSEDQTGIEELRAYLKDKTTLISGQSGVGKSTLINTASPKLDLRTQELSDYSGKGQHTTTFATMYPLDFGGDLIDTPGIKGLSFNNLEPMDVAHNFREFFAYSAQCKFGGNCLHRAEPKCAVRAAVEQGILSDLRYDNYITILEEVEGQNYWERHS